MQPKSPLYNQQHKQPFRSAQILTSQTSGSADCPLTSLNIRHDRLNHKNTTNNPSDFITCHLLHVLKKKILSKSPLGGFEKLWLNRHFSTSRNEKYLCSISPNPTPKRGQQLLPSQFHTIFYNCSLQKNSYRLISNNRCEKPDFCSYWSLLQRSV